MRRVTSNPNVIAGFRCPPEMVMVEVIMIESTVAWANAIPIRPMPLLGNPPLTTTTAAPTNTNPNVPSASAVNRRVSEGMRESRSLLDASEEQAGVDPAEAERVAEQVVRLELHSVRSNVGKIADRIRAMEIYRGWDPTAVTGQGTDRRLNSATRPQRVTVVSLSPAERGPVRVGPEDLLD